LKKIKLGKRIKIKKQGKKEERKLNHKMSNKKMSLRKNKIRRIKSMNPMMNSKNRMIESKTKTKVKNKQKNNRKKKMSDQRVKIIIKIKKWMIKMLSKNK
jgi:hypothetical protein